MNDFIKDFLRNLLVVSVFLIGVTSAAVFMIAAVGIVVYCFTGDPALFHPIVAAVSLVLAVFHATLFERI